MKRILICTPDYSKVLNDILTKPIPKMSDNDLTILKELLSDLDYTSLLSSRKANIKKLGTVAQCIIDLEPDKKTDIIKLWQLSDGQSLLDLVENAIIKLRSTSSTPSKKRSGSSPSLLRQSSDKVSSPRFSRRGSGGLRRSIGSPRMKKAKYDKEIPTLQIAINNMQEAKEHVQKLENELSERLANPPSSSERNRLTLLSLSKPLVEVDAFDIMVLQRLLSPVQSNNSILRSKNQDVATLGKAISFIKGNKKIESQDAREVLKNIAGDQSFLQLYNQVKDETPSQPEQSSSPTIFQPAADKTETVEQILEKAAPKLHQLLNEANEYVAQNDASPRNR